jgi:hypothetical protein
VNAVALAPAPASYEGLILCILDGVEFDKYSKRKIISVINAWRYDNTVQ